MTVYNLDELDGALCAADLYEDNAVRTNYSGRGMYGAECFGIVCDQRSLIQFIIQAARDLEDSCWLSDVRSDSMGLSTIWYWPSVQIENPDNAAFAEANACWAERNPDEVTS